MGNFAQIELFFKGLDGYIGLPSHKVYHQMEVCVCVGMGVGMGVSVRWGGWVIPEAQGLPPDGGGWVGGWRVRPKS